MNKLVASTAAASLLALASQGALAQLTMTLGVDYSEGDYGGPDSTSQWTIPLITKFETGPWTFRLTIPWVESEGTANREVGANVVSESVTQSGLGDIFLYGGYTILDSRTAPVGMDLGARIKFATADSDKFLITTGENDYSIQADFYKAIDKLTPFFTLGWTSKGDPDGIDFKNPWYFSLGASYKVTDVTSLGAAYDYRSKLLDGLDPISEMSLFATHKLTKEWKLQGYGVIGFSDSSPDWGLGATVGYTFQ